MIQINFETIPLVAKHNNNIKIKSNNTNKIVTKNNNFEGKIFNLIMLNNKYIVVTSKIIENIIPNTFPTLFCFLSVLIIKISSRFSILLQKRNRF